MAYGVYVRNTEGKQMTRGVRVTVLIKLMISILSVSGTQRLRSKRSDLELRSSVVTNQGWERPLSWKEIKMFSFCLCYLLARHALTWTYVSTSLSSTMSSRETWSQCRHWFRSVNCICINEGHSYKLTGLMYRYFIILLTAWGSILYQGMHSACIKRN